MKRKGSRWIAATVFIVAAAVWLAGCGSKGSNYPDMLPGVGNVEGTLFVAQYNARVNGAAATPPTGSVALAGATVTVQGTSLSDVTDASGHFLIEGIDVGAQVLVITKTGYETLLVDVTVAKDTTTNLNTSGTTDSLTMVPGGAGAATGTLTVTARTGGSMPVPVEARVTINNVDTGKTTSPAALFTDVSAGSYQVNVVMSGYTSAGAQTAVIAEGQVTTLTFTVSPDDNNYPPYAMILTPVDDQTFAQSASITFSGQGVDSEDGTLTGTSLAWTSSVDGALGTGATLSLTTLSVATHTVTLTATDSGGKTANATVTFKVQASTGSNTAPSPLIVTPQSGTTYPSGTTITFLGGATDTQDGVLGTSSLVWTSSLDGQIGTGTNFTKSTLSVGTHTITLTATDGGGMQGTVSIQLIISGSTSNTAPTAVITTPLDGTVITSGALTLLTGAGTDVEDGVIPTGSMEWSASLDGALGTGRALTTTDLVTAGTQTITLTVTDSGGLTDTTTVSVRVQ